MGFSKIKEKIEIYCNTNLVTNLDFFSGEDGTSFLIISSKSLIMLNWVTKKNSKENIPNLNKIDKDIIDLIVEETPNSETVQVEKEKKEKKSKNTQERKNIPIDVNSFFKIPKKFQTPFRTESLNFLIKDHVFVLCSPHILFLEIENFKITVLDAIDTQNINHKNVLRLLNVMLNTKAVKLVEKPSKEKFLIKKILSKDDYSYLETASTGSDLFIRVKFIIIIINYLRYFILSVIKL